MKKLEDLPKRVDYKVPDGYFDNLPSQIQARVSAGKERSWQFNLGFSMRYALPLLALLAIGVFWYNQSDDSVMSELEKIDENQLTWFLEDPDLTSEELAANVTWTVDDLNALEEEVFNAIDVTGDELDIVIDELDLENL